jgi:hypothetical protein
MRYIAGHLISRRTVRVFMSGDAMPRVNHIPSRLSIRLQTLPRQFVANRCPAGMPTFLTGDKRCYSASGSLLSSITSQVTRLPPIVPARS